VANAFRPIHPNVFDMLDELIAAGHSPVDTCSDLIRAIEDGALVLIDVHSDPWSGLDIRKEAAEIVDSFRQSQRLPLQRQEGFAYGLLEYMKHVHVLRPQFEVVFASVLSSTPTKLRPANDGAIRAALTAVWENAKAKGENPPNVKTVRPLARAVLNQKGLDATGEQIGTIAGEAEFAVYRGKIGVTHRKPH
jgi:hypothetical protein